MSVRFVHGDDGSLVMLAAVIFIITRHDSDGCGRDSCFRGRREKNIDLLVMLVMVKS